VSAQPNWPAIKANAHMIVKDTSYGTPYLQSINVPGWEDGLYMTSDGLHLMGFYAPLDMLSWYNAFMLNPACFNFDPYYRPPLLGIDTVTNPWACPNYIHSDIIIASRTSASQNFSSWTSSNLQNPVTWDGAPDGVLLNSDTFDVFVFTKDMGGAQHEDIYFTRNVPVNPSMSGAVPIMSTASQEDNPNITRINDTTLVLLFDRDRYIYYAVSTDNGYTWPAATQITNVLNDQSPYDVQPNVWFDGANYWVYFCANDSNGVRSIYKSKQLIQNNWNSWAPKQMVLQPGAVTGGYGTVYAVGEPTLTQWGDLSFVVVYGDIASADSTDKFDCDPWFVPKKGSPLSMHLNQSDKSSAVFVYPNPAQNNVQVSLTDKTINEIAVYDLQGKELKHLSLNSRKNTATLDVSNLPNGIYIIKVNSLYTKLIKTNN
jgi:hypothetical protein